jgi:hypothetical protein
MSVTDRDLGWGDMKARLKKLKGAHTKVGVQAGSNRKGGASNVVIGVAHEFGTPSLPSRSFLRSTYEENLPEAARLLAAEYPLVLEGKRDARQSLGLVGAWFQGKVRNKIRAGIDPELSDATKAKRIKGGGRTTPLWDTGQLIQSIQHVEKV